MNDDLNTIQPEDFSIDTSDDSGVEDVAGAFDEESNILDDDTLYGEIDSDEEDDFIDTNAVNEYEE